MKGYDIANNAAVKKMATMEISGNVIPLEWFGSIKRPNGKPNTAAIFLLSDIVYWYRPIEIRDERSGKLRGYRKKFKADKLQRNYGSFASQYGYTKRQVKEALYFLQDMNLIDLDFRHPVIEGRKLGNVLFIGLNVEALQQITHTLSHLNVIGYDETTSDLSHLNATDVTIKGHTNTETPTETPTENTTEITTGTAAASQPVLITYESCIGKHTPMIRKLLADAETLYTTEWVIESLQIAAENNVKKWAYCAAILERWHKEGKVDSKKLNSVTSQVSVVSFVDGPAESSELPDDDSDTDSMGRNKLWLSLIRDERICRITSGKASGMAFLGIETVCFDGSEMRVTIKHPERRETMNANLSKVAGRVLSELVGHTARVAFVEAG